VVIDFWSASIVVINWNSGYKIKKLLNHFLKDGLGIANMNPLRNEIVQRLDVVPDDKLREILSFLNYLVWQNENSRAQEDKNWLDPDLSSLENYEPYEWQEGELEEGLPVKFIAETGKIKISL